MSVTELLGTNFSLMKGSGMNVFAVIEGSGGSNVQKRPYRYRISPGIIDDLGMRDNVKTVVDDKEIFVIPKKGEIKSDKSCETLKQQQPSRGKPSSSSSSSSSSSYRALVSVYTTPEKVERRDMIRSTYMKFKPREMDVMFVVGKRKGVAESEVNGLLHRESERYGDVIILNIHEARDEGKIYEFFRYLSIKMNDRRYDYVFKVDDDTVINMINLHHRLMFMKKWFPQSVYYGHFLYKHVYFASGAIYGVSWDIVNLISSTQRTQRGVEDVLVGSWLSSPSHPWYPASSASPVQHYLSDLCCVYLGARKDYPNSTIAVHRAKTDTQFMSHVKMLYGDNVDRNMYIGYLSLPTWNSMVETRIWGDRSLYIPYVPYSRGGGLGPNADSFAVVTNNKRVGGFAELYVLLQGKAYHLPRNFLVHNEIFQGSQAIVETIEYDLEFVCIGNTNTFTPDILLKQ